MTRTRFFAATVAVGLTASFFAGNLLHSQSFSIHGSVVGTVTDQSGALVPGATVTATNVSTNISIRATADAFGYYRIERLVPGTYGVTAESPGFKKFVRQGITVSTTQTVRVDIALQVGDVVETVEVVEATPLIETESPQISAVRPWEMRKYLPTRNQTFYSTLALDAGATTGDPAFEVSFAGSRPQQYTFSVNGSTFRARPGADGSLVANFNEWQQEVKASYVNNSAEHPVLATVDVASKSGGNHFHGTGVWYYASGGLQARNPFSPTPPSSVTQRFAYSLGGPIRKNRAFFYAAHSGQRSHNTADRNNTVPTALMRLGNFSELSSVIRDPATGAPFPGNAIPPERIYSGSRAFLERFYPLPNFGGPGFRSQNYRQAFPQATAEDNVFVRIDYKLSDKHSLFGSYLFDEGNRGTFFSGQITFPDRIGPRQGYRRPQAATISDIYTFTPNLFNELNLGWTREHNLIRGSTFGPDVLKILGLQGVKALNIPAIPAISIAGFTGVGQQSFQDIAEDSYYLRDNVSWVRGRHRLKTGVIFSQSRLAQVPFQVDQFYGSYSFTNTFASGNALADFLLGIPQSISRMNADFFDRVYRRGNMYQVFVQDDVQLSRRLTLNVGLRYQYHQPFLDKNGRAYTFDPRTATIIVPSEKSLRLLNPLLSDAFKIATAGQARYPDRLVQSDGNNLAPRVGLAYRPFEKTVIRAGYGVFYDFNVPLQGNLAPFIPSESFPPNRIVNGVPLYRLPNPFPAIPNAVGSLSLAASEPASVLPYTQQWNLTLEREFFSNTGVRLSYIGTRQVKSFYGRQINIPPPSTTPFSQARRPYPQFGAITVQDNGVGHFYQALQAQVEYRGRRGLYFRSHWTLAKDLSDDGPAGNPFDRRADKGDTSYIRRHKWTSEAHWEIPVGRKHRLGANWSPAVDRILGGWQSTAILQIATGPYLTPNYGGYDASGTGILSGRPDRIADGNLPSDQRFSARWFDASAFTIPGASPSAPLTPPSGPIGRFGNAGVGILEGPGLWQFDFGLIRGIPLYHEKLRLNLFLLATNLFNHPNLGAPNLNISAPTQVGQIFGIHTDNNASGIGTRQLQLGIRLEF